MGERAHYAPGMFCLVGLAAADPAQATSFYTSLFGWDSEELSAVQSGYSSLRQARGSSGCSFGVRSRRNEWYGATNGSGAITW